MYAGMYMEITEQEQRVLQCLRDGMNFEETSVVMGLTVRRAKY